MLYFKNFTVTPTDSDIFNNEIESSQIVTFYDQEPLDFGTFQCLDHLTNKYPAIPDFHSSQGYNLYCFKNITVANSEKSELKEQIFKQNNLHDWYYFYHGFAALDWYRDYKYFPKSKFKFDKVFMSLNHLMTKDRSYRLNLVARYIESDIVHQGIVSLPLSDVNGTVKQEIFSQTSKLSRAAKKLIYSNIMPLTKPLIADTEFPGGAMSAITDFDFQRKAFWHVVAETVFYHKKLHFTEKIFKPIIARRPFLLAAAPGNLAYLRSYGFKTFGKWVDESYDLETDDDKRLQLIVAQLNKLCQLNRDSLYDMYHEMESVLDYNFNHFYHGDFQTLIVDEMISNFKQLPVAPDLDYDAIRTRLLR